MCKSHYPIVVLVWGLSIFSLLMLNAPRSVEAQSLGEMSCDDLWFARNQIYAQNGHCFKTRRGRSVFGRNCFPPYGQLNSGEQRRIARIQQQERRMACGSGGRTAPSSRRNRLIYPSMSCSALWYERNAIFARNGHCFKSARGRSSFGSGCFPPYGRLGRADQRSVDKIRQWERRGGCR
ncbi:MAG: YARHG domain-containing protein [Rhizobiaceae bacterium]|nr:YARHG domain-containing protein [Rhizobiaceae bacterium]